MSMGAVMFRTGGCVLLIWEVCISLCLGQPGFALSGLPQFPLFLCLVVLSKSSLSRKRPVMDIPWSGSVYFSPRLGFHKAGIKVPFFAFFAKDSGLRTKEAPRPCW